MRKSLSVIGASDSPAPWGLMVSGPAGVGCSSLVQGQQMTGTLLLCMTRFWPASSTARAHTEANQQFALFYP